MQDKEFDSLFRSKLENFEAAPTRQVWDGVVEGLGTRRRYASLLPWLSIAASVLVLVAAGVLLIPHKQVVNPKHPVVAVKQPAAIIKSDTARPQHQQIIQTPAAPVNSMAQIKPARTRIETIAKNPEPVTAPANDVQPQQQIIAQVEQPKQDVIASVVPAAQAPLTTLQSTDVPVAAVPKLTIAAATPPVADVQNTMPARPKRKAHGIGGLLNTVIAAVDKRKDKIIEFTESDDDDGSNLTAVNLGILKFKQSK